MLRVRLVMAMTSLGSRSLGMCYQAVRGRRLHNPYITLSSSPLSPCIHKSEEEYLDK